MPVASFKSLECTELGVHDCLLPVDILLVLMAAGMLHLVLAKSIHEIVVAVVGDRFTFGFTFVRDPRPKRPVESRRVNFAQKLPVLL